MARDVNPPRGMRDFLPAEKSRREHALGLIRQTYVAHGFDEIETPVVEDYERLHSGLGGDNEKLGFSVLKRGLSHDDLAAASAAGDDGATPLLARLLALPAGDAPLRACGSLWAAAAERLLAS